MKEAGIGIVFRSDKQEVLLIKRRDLPVWVLPGGGIEDQESAEKACEREVFEETGLVVRVVRKVGYTPPLNRLIAGAHLFECTALEDPYQTLLPQKESKEVGFYPINNLPAPLFFLHKSWIEETHTSCALSPVTYGACLQFLLRHPLLSLRFLIGLSRNH